KPLVRRVRAGKAVSDCRNREGGDVRGHVEPVGHSAIEPNSKPPTISAIIIAVASATTAQVLRSCSWCFLPKNACSCCHGASECECICQAPYSTADVTWCLSQQCRLSIAMVAAVHN